MQLLEAAKRSHERIFVYLAWDLAAWAHRGLRDLDSARRCTQRALELRARWGASMAKERFEANHAEILLHLDRVEEASMLAAQAATAARAGGSLWALPWAERVWGCALARLGAEAKEVDAHLRESLSIANEVGNVMEALQTAIAWA